MAKKKKKGGLPLFDNEFTELEGGVHAFYDEVPPLEEALDKEAPNIPPKGTRCQHLPYAG